MTRHLFWLVIFLPLLFAPAKPAREAPPEPHRSPIDVAVLPDGRHALTANHTADSFSLVDLRDGKMLVETRSGSKPSAVACSRDGRRAAVSNLWSGTLTLVELHEPRPKVVGEIAVGHLPRGIVFAPDGEKLYVAVGGADEVALVEWKTQKILERWQSPREPRRLALTRDGRWLVAACTRSAEVRCWDTQTGKLAWSKAILEAFNLLGLTLTPDDREIFTSQVHHRHHPFIKSSIEQGWAINSRLARFDVQPAKGDSYWQLALDVRNKAVGDPSALAFSAKGEYLALAAPGTQEMLLFENRALPWVGGEPGDFLDSLLQEDDGRLRRVALGGRPMAIEFTREGTRAVVANYLLDCVQVVDVKAGKVEKTIALGGPKTPSVARRGEAIFLDAKRSHHQWFSCYTCHPDGHTCGRTFDTMNDDSTNNAKLAPSLRGVTKTAPWTWHGWQESLPKAVEKSLTETLWGPNPSEEDVRAMIAYLGTLEHPANPRVKDGKRSAAAERGKALFYGKARCDRCHQGDYYTSPKNFDVKMPSDGSSYDKWNPPSLRSVSDRGPYLHDASAETLDDVLRDAHAPEKLGGKALTPEERRDLVEFLKSL